MQTFLRLTLTFVFFVTATFSEAQLGYTFSASSGSFTANSFATVLHGVNQDDALSAATNIGFTFTYNCQTYTQFKASTNGWLSLGTTASDYLYWNDLDDLGQGPIIAPLWDDLSTNSASSSVNYKVTGPVGNKVLTVEWLNMKWDYNATGAVISLQAKFYQATGAIVFIYRQDGTAINSGSASIGITSGVIGNYYSLNGTGAAPVANYGNETTNLNTKPATGQLYTWTPLPDMTFTSCTAAQPNTSIVSKCGTDQSIVQLQVVTAGGCPIPVTEIQFTMNGSTIPGTNTNDVTKIHIYYTGTHPNFSPTYEFVSGGINPATGTIIANGSQDLLTGTNYFWIAYDINYSSSTIGNLLDAQCTQITVGGAPQVPSATDPAGSRTIAACVVAPGGVNSDLAFWVKANAGTSSTTNGTLISSWNDQSGNVRHATQATAGNQPTYYDNATNNLNFNPVVDFDEAGQSAANGDFMDVLSNNILPAGNEAYTVYSVLLPGPNNNSGSPGKFLFSGTGISTFCSFDIRSGYSVNDSWDLNDLIVGSQWTPAVPLLGTFDFNNVQRTMFTSGSQVGSRINSNRASTNLYSALGCQAAVSPHIEFYDGSMAEIITYPNTSHSPVSRNKIETYLATKYGITLAKDYISSTEVVLWSITSDASYNSNIIGIGRDDISTLSQKQSKSTSATQDILTISIGPAITVNQANNTGTIAAGDQSFFYSGSNAAAATFAASAEAPASIATRLGREWLSQKTNFTNGDLTLTFDLSGAGVFTISDVRLMLDEDGDFTNATIMGNPPVTLSINGNILTAVLDASNFTATPYYTLGIIDNPMPVSFVNIKAYAIEGNVQVDWSTASESNNKFFDVERSKEGVNFELVQKVDGAGNSSVLKKYSVTDNQPYSGASYYRVKQIDNDGNISYSPTVGVEIGIHFQLFPNPVTLKDISSVKIYDIEESEEVLVTLYDVNGKELFSKIIITGVLGNSVIGFDPQMNIAPGLYLITATSHQKIYELKLIIK